MPTLDLQLIQAINSGRIDELLIEKIEVNIENKDNFTIILQNALKSSRSKLRILQLNNLNVIEINILIRALQHPECKVKFLGIWNLSEIGIALLNLSFPGVNFQNGTFSTLRRTSTIENHTYTIKPYTLDLTTSTNSANPPEIVPQPSVTETTFPPEKKQSTYRIPGLPFFHDAILEPNALHPAVSKAGINKSACESIKHENFFLK